MASYEYECPSDNEVIVIKRAMSDPEGEYFCDVCGSRLRRIYHAPPVKFNGGGFYSTGG